MARLQALDASLVVALRQSLASFADLASEQGQVLASMEASHRVMLEQQVLSLTGLRMSRWVPFKLLKVLRDLVCVSEYCVGTACRNTFSMNSTPPQKE